MMPSHNYALSPQLVCNHDNHAMVKTTNLFLLLLLLLLLLLFVCLFVCLFYMYMLHKSWYLMNWDLNFG